MAVLREPRRGGAEREPVPWGPDATLEIAGRDVPRLEAEAKVTGRARYASDIRLPGLLYARVLRSPHPHARVVRIDTSRAEAIPGVRAVLTAWNAPEIRWYEDSFLFDRTVRFVGDEVAAVAADTEEIAEDALASIRVEYEPLPFVLDVAEALQPGAPALHAGGNLAGEPEVYQRGDPDAGLREAEVVVDAVYTTQAALHNCMEPHGCTALWDGEELILWSSTQSVFTVREEVAACLAIPERCVRVIAEHMGGGFGSKQIAWKHDAIAALLARRTGRPVRLILDREAENLAVGNRNPTRQRVRLGARRDGTLTAIVAEIVQQIGAYRAGGEASDVPGAYHRLYRCPNVRTERKAVYTHTGPAVAFRAPGYVEGMFALESAMDELARALGMDPIELRLRNYAVEDQVRGRPYTSPDGLRRCLEAAAEAFGWRNYPRERPAGARRRGIGFAAHDWGGGGWPPAYVWIRLNSDGTAEVITGTQDIGTGTRTALAQVAAEELGLPLDRIGFHLGDTGRGPYAPVSAGSATLATLGPAVREAACEVRRKLLQATSRLLEVPVERMRVRDGRIETDDGRQVPVEEVTRRLAPEQIQGFGARGPNPADRSVRTFGAQCVEVEVDTETGEITVLRVVAAHDCGRVIDPRLVESQVIGGVTMGAGFALLEERVVDARTGIVLNANLEDYRVPTAADLGEIVRAGIDLPDPAANLTAAKGIGEPPIVPTAPAIANAIFDAVGVRIRDLPITRRRLLEALGQATSRATGESS